jgi:hypothetical protein
VPQTSPNLVNWTDIPAENITPLADADLYTEQYQASVAQPTNGSIFLRVLVRPLP